MNIRQFRYGDTNLAYLVWSGTDVAAIDGGAAAEILAFIGMKGLQLRYVLNTHEHYDHIPGNETLLEKTEAVIVSPQQMCEQKILSLNDEQLEAFPTPGHTEDSIAFFLKVDGKSCLVTGDTLFNGTVGNCYTRNYELYFDSLNKILRFPPETQIYAGHDIFDYTTGIMDKIDPDNPLLPEYRRSYKYKNLVTTLGQETAVNPFIRFNDPALDNYRRSLKMPVDTPYLRFRAMMSVH